MKKTLLFTALLGSALFLGACSDSDEKTDKKEDAKAETEVAEEKAEQKLEEQGAVDKSESAKSDEELKEDFAKEEGVTSVSIIITEDSDGFVLADFEVDEGMKEKDAEALASKFADSLKEKYKEYQIDVQARKAGETFAQKTLK
jgi:PBP1b-binding outer membrane lipoprotein LpoB